MTARLATNLEQHAFALPPDQVQPAKVSLPRCCTADGGRRERRCMRGIIRRPDLSKGLVAVRENAGIPPAPVRAAAGEDDTLRRPDAGHAVYLCVDRKSVV